MRSNNLTTTQAWRNMQHQLDHVSLHICVDSIIKTELHRLDLGESEKRPLYNNNATIPGGSGMWGVHNTQHRSLFNKSFLFIGCFGYTLCFLRLSHFLCRTSFPWSGVFFLKISNVSMRLGTQLLLYTQCTTTIYPRDFYLQQVSATILHIHRDCQKKKTLGCFQLYHISLKISVIQND